jgi:RNA polymerase sigma-70 factor (ECF subfamily)
VRDPHAAHEDIARDRLEAVREALAVVPADQRDVLMLRFVVGLTPGEIAERLGRSENAIHALQHRGRRRLRQELIRLEAAPAVSGG